MTRPKFGLTDCTSDQCLQELAASVYPDPDSSFHGIETCAPFLATVIEEATCF